jgi:hypothetical protein
MESFHRFISQYVPWFWPVIAWVIALLGLIVILAFPAYFVIFPLARSLRESVSAYLTRLLSKHAEELQKRRTSMEALVAGFEQNSQLTNLPERTIRLEAAVTGFSAIARRLNAQLTHFRETPDRFQHVAEDLVSASMKATPPSVPELPSLNQLSVQHGSLRTSKARLAVSSGILLGLISVNTGMLGQILRALNFIPHDLEYFGIKLYLILAFLLTLIEAGLGYVHTAGRPPAEQRQPVAVWPLVAVALAILIAGVEGFFYSQVAPNRDALFPIPIGFEVRQGSLFFSWGAALVLALFGLGSIWSQSLERITQSAHDFPAFLARLSKQRTRYATACERSEKSIRHVHDEVEEARQSLQSGAEQANSIEVSIQRVRDEAAACKEPLVPHRLTSAEVYHFMQLSGLWLMLTCFLTLIIMGTAFYAFGSILSYVPSAAAALGIGGGFLVLGFLFPRGDLLLHGTGTRRLVVSGSPWRGEIVLTLAGFITVALVAVIWRVRLARPQVAIWILLYLLGGFLTAAASQAVATSKGLRLWFHRCGHVLRSLVEGLVRIAVRVVLGIVFVIEVLALGFAAPIFLLRGRELPSLQLQSPAVQP